jgi:hypothetical protein
MQAMDFIENVTLGSDIPVTLKGGYSCDFSSNTGMSVVNGSVTIKGGTATVENITIK